MAEEKQYALVHNGEVVKGRDAIPCVSGFQNTPPEKYSAEYPAGCRWVEVVSEDSRPFDPDKHWRTEPILEVRGDKVARIYGVVDRVLG